MKKALAKIYLALFMSLIVFFNFFSVAFAQGSATAVEEPKRMCELTTIIVKIFNWIMALSPLGGLGILIYGAFLWATAGPEPQKLEQAKKTLTYGIIGFIIGLSAILIVATIENFLLEKPLYDTGLLDINFCIVEYQED